MSRSTVSQLTSSIQAGTENGEPDSAVASAQVVASDFRSSTVLNAPESVSRPIQESSATEDIKHVSDPGLMPLCKMVQNLLKELVDSKDSVSGKPLLSKELQRDVCQNNEIFSQKSVLVSVLGPHNAGKSALINTLLKKIILPESDTNETSVTVRIEPMQCGEDDDPVLEVTNDDTGAVFISMGKDSIKETIKDLNQKARDNIVPGSVVLRVSAPELFGGVEEGWQVCLLDNPGFGEDNQRIQKIAEAAVAPSTVYVFLTITEDMAGSMNAEFFRNLERHDINAFRDGRLIVVITKMDRISDGSMDESNHKTPKEWVKTMCENISKATSIPNISADIVIPVSCSWYRKSTRLADTPSEKSRQLAIESLEKCPYFEVEATGQGMSRHQSLQDLSSSEIVRRLDDASGRLLLTDRIKKMVSDTVSTWKGKVMGEYQCCLVCALEELQILAEKENIIMKDLVDELTSIQRMLAKVVTKSEELSCCLSECTLEKICQELEEQFDQDLFTGTLEDKVTMEVETLLKQFKEECVSRIKNPMDIFGPPEFESGLEHFLQKATSKINEFFDTTVILALPHALQMRTDPVERICRNLFVDATSLSHITRRKTGGKIPEGHADSSLPDQSTKRNPFINLADLKKKIYIPPVTLSVWEKIKQLLRSVFTSWQLEGRTQLIQQYRKEGDISEVFQSGTKDIQKECLEYIDHQIKPKAVEYHTSQYVEKVRKCRSDFEQQHASTVTEAEGCERELRKKHENLKERKVFIAGAIAQCTDFNTQIKEHLKQHLLNKA